MREPLTPTDCDLRGLSYMPLDVQRLRDSDLALISTGDEFKAAVVLWSVSWSQVPAASLPDDERLLAALARLDPKAWRKVREVALRGWEKCSDGRLYHSVVAEKACEAWQERIQYRAKRDKDRDRLKAWRDGQKQPDETPPSNDGNAIETSSETRFETQPEEKGTCSEGIKKEPPIPPGGQEGEAEFVLAWRAYPEEGRATIGMQPARMAWVAETESVSPKALLAAVVAYAGSEYAKVGKPKRFDRWLSQGAYVSFLAVHSSAPPWAGPPDIRAKIAAEKGEPWTVGWLDRCTWRDLPDKAIVSASPTTVKRLTEELGDDLAELGIAIRLEAIA